MKIMSTVILSVVALTGVMQSISAMNESVSLELRRNIEENVIRGIGELTNEIGTSEEEGALHKQFQEIGEAISQCEINNPNSVRDSDVVRHRTEHDLIRAHLDEVSGRLGELIKVVNENLRDRHDLKQKILALQNRFTTFDKNIALPISLQLDEIYKVVNNAQ